MIVIGKFTSLSLKMIDCQEFISSQKIYIREVSTILKINKFSTFKLSDMYSLFLLENYGYSPLYNDLLDDFIYIVFYNNILSLSRDNNIESDILKSYLLYKRDLVINKIIEI